MAKRARLHGRERALTAYFTTVGNDIASTSQTSPSLSYNLSEYCFHDTEICSEADESDLECEPDDDCESEDTPPDERKDLYTSASV